MSSSELRIVEWQNEWIVKGAFPYAYQGPDDMPAQLRRRYRLDEVIQPGQTEFEQMLLLREWVRNRWNHGWTRTPEARNALEILEAAELVRAPVAMAGSSEMGSPTHTDSRLIHGG